ncbi:acetylxylan esterase [Persicobacter psychrovividus]|uniref:Cephalosporin deacetylase n=1 Tax=Persicobacter psychrovividus TaxID=387638 RepID=A0ABM7VJ47_9BACT|nr:cephalosporin deacetylase [Persicobacter psychrovividus]
MYKQPFSTTRALWLCLMLALLFPNLAHSNERGEMYYLKVTPTAKDWTYATNEEIVFHVEAKKFGQPISALQVRYEIGQELMTPSQKGEVQLTNGTATIKGFKAKKPGFYTCRIFTTIDGKEKTVYATAGVAPEKIKAVTKMPKDFDAFWQKAREEQLDIPLEPIITLQAEECTSDYDVYHVSFQNMKKGNSWRGVSRVYGMLSVPKKAGQYPAVLEVPGAGVRAYHANSNAKRGAIFLTIGIHGIPVNVRDDAFYKGLATGALSGYFNYQLESKDDYYYKRVYLGCVRAIDFIEQLPKYNGEDLLVTGGSQGGALSIVTAGLDQRVKYLAPLFPALCDMAAYTKGQTGGWPHMFRDFDASVKPNWVENIAYFDVVNFARKLTAKGFYSWGFNDNVCPPTSMYAAYNEITAPKELTLFQDTGHWTYAEQAAMRYNWIFEQFKNAHQGSK